MSSPPQARLLIREAWPYEDALAWMEQAWTEVVGGGRMQVAVGSHRDEVITLGRHAPPGEVLDDAGLRARGARVVRIDRGGGATAHGPGQLVLYPVVDLAALGWSIPAFTRVLEEVAIDLLRDHGLVGQRLEGLPGVYVGGRKVAALGFRSRRRVVTHGLAINVGNDLSLFSYIAPCGERDREVTSIERERATARSDDEMVVLRRDMDRLAHHFCNRAMVQCRA